MKNTKWGYPVVLVLVVILAVFFASRTKMVNEERTKLTGIYVQSMEAVDGFHKDMETNLTFSSSSREVLSGQLTRLFNMSENVSDDLEKLRSQAQSLSSSNANIVIETIDSATEYIKGYGKFVHNSIKKNNLLDLGGSMLENIRVVQERLDVLSAPSKGNVSTAVDLADKLIINHQKLSTSKTVIVYTERMASSYPTWVDTSAQRGAFDRVRQIAQEISQSRRYLGSKAGINWSNGKSGNWGYFEMPRIQDIFRAVLREKIRQRQEIEAIENIEGMDDLSYVVKSMLDNSINGFNSMIGRADYGAFSIYNQKNNALADTLKRRYGIVAR